MDIMTILPLLLAGKSGGKKSETLALLLKTMGSGKKPDESAIMDEMLKKSGCAPETAAVLNAAMKNRTEKPRRSVGLRSVLGIVNDEILGKITKYMDDVR